MREHPQEQAIRASHTDRVAGCLVGLAVGDALGAPVEFLNRQQVRNQFPQGLRDMIAARLWSKGEYTDDTQMTLLIAESLLEKKGFVATDIAGRFQLWAKTAKDVGVPTVAVVSAARYTDDPERCSSRYHAANPSSSAGNGALMRCAPIALFYLNSPEHTVEFSRAAARLTHYDPRVQSSCVILNTWIRTVMVNGIRDGRPEALAMLKPNELAIWRKLASIEAYKEDDVASSGYTVHTLEAAAWSFLTTES
jgi:ADP-ribosyl-[dinitrogen reductase] hydrolase